MVGAVDHFLNDLLNDLQVASCVNFRQLSTTEKLNVIRMWLVDVGHFINNIVQYPQGETNQRRADTEKGGKDQK